LYDDAIEEYKVALTLNNLDAKTHFYLGIAYRDKGDYNEAARELDKSLQLNAKMTAAYEELGMIYYRNLKDSSKAISNFEKLLSLEPSHPRADKIQEIINMLKSGKNN